MNAHDSSQIRLGLSDHNDPGDVLDVSFLGRVATGREPHAREAHLPHARQRATLRPGGTSPLATFADGHGRVELTRGPDWSVLVRRARDGSATVRVSAATAGLADETLAACLVGARARARPSNRTVFGFWSRELRQAERTERSLERMAWSSVRRNYPEAAVGELDRLMALTPDRLSGRLLVLHGPPGTGKTTVLRALADAWRRWCQLDYVLDPERLLGQPGYLLSTMLQEVDGPGDRRRLLVLEDCDELLRAEARAQAGQDLSRLLNVTDGLLAQGTQLLVAITTNEPLWRLHPAVVRPGRCLARIEIGRFPPAEARAWLGRPVPIDAAGATLAELFAMRDGENRPEATGTAASTGQYL